MDIVSQSTRTQRLEQQARWAIKKWKSDKSEIRAWLAREEATHGPNPELNRIVKAEYKIAYGNTELENQKALVDDSIDFVGELGA